MKNRIKYKFKLVFLIFSILTLTSFVSFKSLSTLPSEISKAIEKGDSDELADFFNKNIELKLLNKNNIYSRQQAKLIIDNFFATNEPEKLEVLYESQGNKESIQMFGKLTTTDKKTFTIYIYINEIADEFVITRFKIEKL